MAFHLAHAGTKLYHISASGTALELSLPTGVTLSDERRGRFAILGRVIVMVNAPSRNIQIDANCIVRILNAAAPTVKPTTATGGAGALTGDYRYCYTFCIFDGARLLSESSLSPASDVLTLATERVAVSDIAVSTDAGVNGRRLYRTAADGGESYFLCTTINDNTTTTFTDNQTDEELSLFPAETDLGEPQGTTTTNRFEEITPWKDRLWAMGSDDPDRIYFSGNLRPFAWAADAYVTAKPEGRDYEGATAFAARRDELGIGKRRQLWKVIGNDPDTFQMIQVAEGTGIWAPESVVVIRDEAYFLAEDGVYRWGPGGLTNLSRTKVHPWFTEDDTFNRALFSSAFAIWNQRTDSYQLHLAAAGSTVIDRWVTLDLKALERGEFVWLGPHKTDAFTPTCGAVLEDDDGLVAPYLGASTGLVYKGNASRFSDDGTAIAFDVSSKYHSANEPDRHHYWGELSMHTRIETAGTLTVTPKVGRLDAAAQNSIAHDLTTGRQRLRRMGVGPLCQLRLQNSEDEQRVEVYAYEIDPVYELGRR